MGITLKPTVKSAGFTDKTAIVRSMQQAIFDTLKKHYRIKNAQGNSKGWWRSNFWNNEVSNNTHNGELSDSKGEVVVSSLPYAHKISGGPITPQKAKALAIPATSEAKKLITPSAVMTNPAFKYVPLKAGNVVGMIVKGPNAPKPSKKPLGAYLPKHDKLTKMRNYLGTYNFKAPGSKPSGKSKKSKRKAARKAAKKSKEVVYWWLVKGVNQNSDATAEPPQASIDTAVNVAMNREMKRQLSARR